MKFQITLTGEALKELERLKKKEKLENFGYEKEERWVKYLR